MTIEEIRRRKEELGYSTEQLSGLSGVPIGTLQKILSGQTKVPRFETRKALEKVLFRDSAEGIYETQSSQIIREAIVKEPTIAYGPEKSVPDAKRQGEYTLEDYLALPDEERVELIDGVIYKMLAPTYIHQRFTFYFAFLVQNYINKKHGTCIPIVAPVDVRLDCDEKTVVQPDVLIVCDRSKIYEWGILGAPDFVLEVLSKSTRKKDLGLKLKKYLNAGVREYWILDPREKRLYVYNFMDEGIPGVYPLEGEVGIGIFNGDLKIPLGELAAMFDEVSQSDGPITIGENQDEN